MSESAGFATFIVRTARDEAGSLSGVVERVKTGEKGRFQGLDGMRELIARMVADAVGEGATRDGAGREEDP